MLLGTLICGKNIYKVNECGKITMDEWYLGPSDWTLLGASRLDEDGKVVEFRTLSDLYTINAHWLSEDLNAQVWHATDLFLGEERVWQDGTLFTGYFSDILAARG